MNRAHQFPDAVRSAGIEDFFSKLRQAGVPLGHIAELLAVAPQ